MSTRAVKDTAYSYRKYYYAGSTRIAMRLYEGETSTLYWLLGDHLGSQSITANADGSFHSEVRYSAFGETRYTSATETPTDYLYTGQRIEEEAGLYYYGARFYDPVLAHFVQADTVVQTVSNFLSWVRYAYVKFNPLIYIDPSGHTPANGCSSELDTGNCPVDWDNGGLDDGGSGGNNGDATGPGLTNNGKKQKKLFEKFMNLYPNATIYDFLAYQLGQEFANVDSFDVFTCDYSRCLDAELTKFEQEAMLIEDLRASAVNSLFGFIDSNYGTKSLSRNATFNWLGAAFQSARGNADYGIINFEGQSEYGRYLGDQMAKAISENVNNGSVIRIYNNSPRSWGNQNQWNHFPRELGVTPLWEISEGNPWYLLDNYGADIMFRDRK